MSSSAADIHNLFAEAAKFDFDDETEEEKEAEVGAEVGAEAEEEKSITSLIKKSSMSAFSQSLSRNYEEEALYMEKFCFGYKEGDSVVISGKGKGYEVKKILKRPSQSPSGYLVACKKSGSPILWMDSYDIYPEI